LDDNGAHELEVVGAVGLWSVQADPSQLENALLNLCINARDAMPNGGKLTIETANCWIDGRGGADRGLKPGHYVSLCVSDNGVGMSPEVASRAFDPFFTIKPIGMGTGLGLSMIHGFANQSGGEARIYSEPEEGTMVCLYLPRADEEEVTSQTSALEPGLQPIHGAKTVLVVEDDPTIRVVTVDLLTFHLPRG
jgi:signal transduction histidine kinase